MEVRAEKQKEKEQRSVRKIMATPVPDTFAQPDRAVRGLGAALEDGKDYFFLASLAFFFSLGLIAGAFLVSLVPLSLPGI